MFETIGAPELLIIGLVVILLFGVGKLSNLGKDLGSSVKEFRRAMREDEEAAAGEPAPTVVVEAPAQLLAPTTVSAAQPAPETNRGPQVF